MGCLGTGACATAIGTACVHGTVFTAGTACLAAAGVLGTMGCADAAKSCVGKRRLVTNRVPIAPKRRAVSPPRRNVTFGQMMGCLGTGACATAIGTACVHGTVFTEGTACLAAAGVLGTMG